MPVTREATWYSVSPTASFYVAGVDHVDEEPREVYTNCQHQEETSRSFREGDFVYITGGGYSITQRGSVGRIIGRSGDYSWNIQFYYFAGSGEQVWRREVESPRPAREDCLRIYTIDQSHIEYWRGEILPEWEERLEAMNGPGKKPWEPETLEDVIKRLHRRQKFYINNKTELPSW